MEASIITYEVVINLVLLNNLVSSCTVKRCINLSNYLLLVLGLYKRGYGFEPGQGPKELFPLIAMCVIGFVSNIMIYCFVSDIYNLKNLGLQNVIIENKLAKAHKDDIEEIFSNLDQGIAVVEKDQLSLSN
jgi:hypothetical protein